VLCFFRNGPSGSGYFLSFAIRMSQPFDAKKWPKGKLCLTGAAGCAEPFGGSNDVIDAKITSALTPPPCRRRIRDVQARLTEELSSLDRVLNAGCAGPGRDLPLHVPLPSRCLSRGAGMRTPDTAQACSLSLPSGHLPDHLAVLR
jgi:hypothetical protein